MVPRSVVPGASTSFGRRRQYRTMGEIRQLLWRAVPSPGKLAWTSLACGIRTDRLSEYSISQSCSLLVLRLRNTLKRPSRLIYKSTDSFGTRRKIGYPELLSTSPSSLPLYLYFPNSNQLKPNLFVVGNGNLAFTPSSPSSSSLPSLQPPHSILILFVVGSIAQLVSATLRRLILQSLIDFDFDNTEELRGIDHSRAVGEQIRRTYQVSYFYARFDSLLEHR